MLVPMRGRALAGLLLALLSGCGTAWAQSSAHLANADTVRARLGLSPAYDGVAGVEAVKVAVLDYGFEGLGDGRGYLPENAEVVEHYDPDFVRRFDLGDPAYRKDFEPGNRHGRIMAQIVWATTGARPGGPKFYLLNASGPTMLRRAVRHAIENRVDVILFSGSFEGGGQGDGRGPIDRIVDDAVSAGILWINAAGNYGGRVYNGPVQVLKDGFLRLRNGADVASLRFRNHVDENTVTITLTWNDYRDQEDAGTDKDLDFFVEDWAGRRVGSGDKVQVSGTRAAGPDASRNPRERIVLTNLPANPRVPSDPDYGYRIRIERKRGSFTPADRIRVLVTASREVYLPPGSQTPRKALEFLDATGEGEIYPPADHRLVLTVGDGDPASSIGPTGDGRTKPDALLENSRADFSDGEVSSGSSNAAAYVAGVVAVLKAAAPGLRPADLVRLARQGPAVPAPVLQRRAPRPPDAVARSLRLWQTPSRTRLAEILGPGR
jgi:hypothetical protein